MKILSITKKISKEVALPDGVYTGKWGGSQITVDIKDDTFYMKTENGVRGFDIDVVVIIKDGVATFEQTGN